MHDALLCTCCARFNKRIIYHSVYEARAIIDDKYWQMPDRACCATAIPLSSPPKHPGSSLPYPLLPSRGRRGDRQRAPQNRGRHFRGFFRGIVGPRGHRCTPPSQGERESQCINQAVSMRGRATMFDSARGIAVGPQRRVKILNRGAFSWRGGKTTIWLDDKWHPVAHSARSRKHPCHFVMVTVVTSNGNRSTHADESRNRSYSSTLNETPFTLYRGKVPDSARYALAQNREFSNRLTGIVGAENGSAVSLGTWCHLTKRHLTNEKDMSCYIIEPASGDVVQVGSLYPFLR